MSYSWKSSAFCGIVGYDVGYGNVSTITFMDRQCGAIDGSLLECSTEIEIKR